MQRYNSRLSFDSDVSKRFKVGAALGYTMTKRHSGAAGEEMGITREWNVRPDVPVYDETGELYRIDGTPTWGFPVGLANPVANRQNKNKKESFHPFRTFIRWIKKILCLLSVIKFIFPQNP